MNSLDMTTILLLVRFLLSFLWVCLILFLESIVFSVYRKLFSKRRIKPWGARYETINSNWLTLLLREKGVLDQDIKVESLRMERFGEIGQMSQVYRMHLAYSKPAAGPETLVLKTTLFEIKNRLFNKVFGVFGKEISAYQLPNPTSGLLMPRCWYSTEQSITASAFLILDDLKDWRGLQSLKRISVEDIERVVVALSEHQATWWNSSQLFELGFKSSPKKVKEELNPMCQLTWSKARTIFSALLPNELLTTLDIYIENQEKITECLFQGNKTLCHGDLNANNLFFHDEQDKICAVDWQTTYIGNWAEDLAYLLVMGLSRDDYSSYISRLKELYRSQMSTKQIEFDELAFENEYAIAVLQCIALMIVGVQVLSEEDNPELYNFFLESIGNWAEAVPGNIKEILSNML